MIHSSLSLARLSTMKQPSVIALSCQLSAISSAVGTAIRSLGPPTSTITFSLEREASPEASSACNAILCLATLNGLPTLLHPISHVVGPGFSQSGVITPSTSLSHTYPDIVPPGTLASPESSICCPCATLMNIVLPVIAAAPRLSLASLVPP